MYLAELSTESGLATRRVVDAAEMTSYQRSPKGRVIRSRQSSVISKTTPSDALWGRNKTPPTNGLWPLTPPKGESGKKSSVFSCQSSPPHPTPAGRYDPPQGELL
jgi:hypothetical protein